VRTMFRSTFHWLVALAAVAGGVSGFLSGRQTGEARIVETSSVVKAPDESSAPAKFAPAVARRSAAPVEKDFASIIALRSRFRREAALLGLADSLDEANIEAAINEAEAIDSDDREWVLLVLFTRWAEFAPEAAANVAIKTKAEVLHAILEGGMGGA